VERRRGQRPRLQKRPDFCPSYIGCSKPRAITNYLRVPNGGLGNGRCSAMPSQALVITRGNRAAKFAISIGMRVMLLTRKKWCRRNKMFVCRWHGVAGDGGGRLR